MKNGAAVIAITFLMVSSLLAQVHIKESATITPVQAKKVQDGEANNHKLSFTLTWTDAGDSAEVWVLCPHKLETFSSVGGCISGEIQPLIAGTYGFGVYRDSLKFDGICLTVYYDDSLIYSGSGPSALVGEGPWYLLKDLGTGFTTPYFSKFELLFDNCYLTYGQSMGFSLVGYDDTTATVWSSETDPVTLTLISGSQYASFYEYNSQYHLYAKMGSSVMTVGDSIDNFSLVDDGVLPDSSAEWIMIEAESHGMTNVDSVEVASPPVVTIVPSEISTGDTAVVNVQWRNPDGTLTDYSSMSCDCGSSYFEAGICSGENYGMLLADYCDEEEYFAQINPPFCFVAADSIDADSVTVGIRVGVSMSSGWTSNIKEKRRIVESQSGTTSSKGKSPPPNLSAETSHKETLSETQKTTSQIAAKGRMTVSSFNDPNYGIGWVKIKKRSGPNLNLPRYPQDSSAWADSTYDHTKNTIRQKGCALCLMAWGLTACGYPINPLQLNDWMNDPKNLDPYNGSGVNWYAMEALSGGNLSVDEIQMPANEFGKDAYSNKPSILDGYLNDGDLVFVEVKHLDKNNEVHTHWVGVKSKTDGEYRIADMGYSGTSTLKDYGNIFWEYVVVSTSKGK